MKTRSRTRGFTLIELLVVIAIIAILAAILFPVFARAREAARKSSCQSNLNQLGKGFLMYTQDYDEAFPAIWLGQWNIRTGNTNWGPAIQPYIKNRQVYKCPSDSLRNTGSSYNGNNWLHLRSDAGIVAHADCIVLMDGYTSENNQYDPRNNTFNNPGNTTQFAEYGLNADYTIWNAVSRATRRDKGLPRHSETNNVVYADGHVKTTPAIRSWGTVPNAEALASLQGALPYNKHLYQGTANAWVAQ